MEVWCSQLQLNHKTDEVGGRVLSNWTVTESRMTFFVFRLAAVEPEPR